MSLDALIAEVEGTIERYEALLPSITNPALRSYGQSVTELHTKWLNELTLIRAGVVA